MSWWSSVKTAASKVATAVKNVAISAAKVITTAQKISSPSLLQIISTAAAVVSSARNTSSSANSINETNDRETAEKDAGDIRKETEIIKEAVAPIPEKPWYEKALDFLKDVAAEKFTLSPKVAITPSLNLLQDAIIKKADREDYDLPDWLWETGLAMFFLDIEDFGDEKILAGTVPIAPAGNIMALIKAKGFIKALDAMKKNTLKYADNFAKLSPKTAAQILKGMKKDQLASLATNVFKASWDDALIKTAPAWKRAMFSAAKHKWLGAFGLISLAGTIMGTDIWGNWSIVDNLQFMSGRDSDEIKAAFLDGTMSREDALKELNQLLAIVEVGETKVKTSAGWNLMQIIFAPLWDDLAALTTDKIKRRIAEVEEITPPTETEEDKWIRIREEADERRAEEIKADEERYAKIIADADKRKAEARKDEADYYEKIRIEAEASAAAAKLREEEYWAGVQEAAKLAEEEKRISAEEYWAKVEADKIAAREIEDAYWEAKLAGPKKATITLTSEPSNAEVYIDGEFTWTTTPYTTLLPIGDHVFRIQKEGYYPLEIVAEIEDGDVAEIPFTLELIPIEDKPVETYLPQTPYYKTYTPAEPYTASIISTPKEEIPALDFPLLYPEKKPWVPYEERAPELEKELLVNIETTGVKPWESRIYSIAVQDLSMPGSEPIVLINNSEENLIRDFLEIFNSINPEKLVGFKLIFDYRFIFTKMMNYRIQNKAFKDIALKDIKQIMDQVKEEFVYFPSKIGTLDDWGKMLLGKGKYGAQELMLRKYLAGDFDYVKQFQLRQLDLTKGLYDLSRFASSEALLPTPALEIPQQNPVEQSFNPEPIQSLGQIQCPNCKSFQSLDNEFCDICKIQLKGGEQNV